MTTTVTDFAHTPYAEQKRVEKAVEIEMVARELGYDAEHLDDEDNRKRILVAVAKGRGVTPSKVRASDETWAVVRRLMAEVEADRKARLGL